MSFKKANVVMLPTKNSNLNGIVERVPYYNGENFKSKLEINKSPTNTFNNLKAYKPKHLYIISDDPIKEGDVIMDIFNNTFKEALSDINYSESKKVIATTDTNIQEKYTCFKWTKLPQPSQSFIQKYIEEYNKGNIITDVLVEYEGVVQSSTWEYDEPEYYRVKLSKDNTITINRIKDRSKEEVIELLYSLNRDKPGDFDCTSWIEENL
jgi:hypothetical protein